MHQMNWDGLSATYQEKTGVDPQTLATLLNQVAENFEPDSFMLLQCDMLDSSYGGELTILPVGGKATFKEVPDRPISPRGLASDMSSVIGVIAASSVPDGSEVSAA